MARLFLMLSFFASLVGAYFAVKNSMSKAKEFNAKMAAVRDAKKAKAKEKAGTNDDEAIKKADENEK